MYTKTLRLYFGELRLSAVFALSFLLAISCTQQGDLDSFEPASDPTSVASAFLTPANSSMLGSFEEVDASTRRVTCQITNFIGDTHVVASVKAPGVEVAFLEPLIEGGDSSISVEVESETEFERSYIVSGTNFFDLKFTCQGTVSDNETSELRKDEVRFFQLKSLLGCLLYTSPSPRDKRQSRMPSSA